MENKLTVNYATAWLMGVDPAATGARLKQYRNANHLTQEGLSGILTDGGDPASRVSISMWESGKKLPTLSHLVFLRELYGCTLDELICTYRQSAREAADGDQPVVFYYDLLLNAAGCMPAAFFALQSALHGVNRWYIVVFWHRQYTLTMITAGSQDSRNKAAYKLETQGGTTMKNINCKKDKDRILCVTVRAPLAKRPGRPVRYVGAHNFYYQPAGSKEIAYLLSMKKYAATVYHFFEANGRLVCDEDTCMTHSITLGQLYTSRADHSNFLLNKLFQRLPAQIEYVCRYELGAAKAADELLEAVPARRFDGERDAA